MSAGELATRMFFVERGQLACLIINLQEEAGTLSQ